MDQEFSSWDEVMAHHNQAIEVQRHEIRSFMHELSEVQLGTLAIMLSAFIGDGGSERASRMQGMVLAILDEKFGLCWACEQNPCKTDHAVQMLTKQANHGIPLDEDMGGSSGLERKVRTGPRERQTDEIADLRVGEDGALSPRQVEEMSTYRLDDLRDRDTGQLVGFICLDCGDARYSSIEDRKLKPPGKEHCSGCVNQQKWG